MLNDASHNTPEPAPILNAGQPVWPLAIMDIKEQAEQQPTDTFCREIAMLVSLDACERDDIGTKKYGTPLCVGDGRTSLKDGYQETLDQLVYFRKEIEECDGDPIELDILNFVCEQSIDIALAIKSLLLRRQQRASDK